MRALAGCLAACLLPLALGGARVAADDGPALPGRLAGLTLPPAECERWDAQIAALAEADRRGAAAQVRAGRVLLRGGGLPALARCATALRRTQLQGALALQLLRVVADDPTPEAEALLVEATTSQDPGARAVAAEGLVRDGASAGLDALLALCADPFPGVRAAAQRALFARESAAAVAARCARTPDPDPQLEARRLTLHRLRQDATPALGERALEAWQHGATPALRLAAARLLATSGLVTPTARLLEIARETGWGPAAAVALRWAAGTPLAGYDTVEERRVAIEATLAALTRPDLAPETRLLLVDRCVEWVAHPTRMDARGPDPIPEHALRRRLPDLGPEVAAALERRFEGGGFDAPRDGTMLLAELPVEQALPLLVRLVDRARPQAVRAAASGALRALGHLGSRELAERLLEPEEEASIRRDAVGALAVMEEPWTVTLLAGLLEATSAETVESALDALEERGEPEARQRYEAYVLGGRCPEHRVHARLTRLLLRWDDDARATFTRALASEHAALRAAALSLAARFPRERLAEVLPLLLAREPLLAGAREVEAWIGALARAAPAHVLDYVRARWNDFPVGPSLASTQCRSLAALDAVRHTRQDAAALDLVLEKAAGSGDPLLLSHALEALAGRQGHRDPELDALFARLLEGAGVDGGEERRDDLAAGVVDALQRPGRGDLTRLLLPMLARLAPDPDQSHRAVAVLRALAHQPWDRVEPEALRLVLDPVLPSAVRAAAGRLLAGRVGPAPRERLAAWLLDLRQGEAEPEVLLAIAAAAGTGGGPELAVRFATLLEAQVRAFHEQDPPPDPFEPRLDALPTRVQALAAAAAHAGTGPVLDRLVRMVVDERYVPWAERVLRVGALGTTTPDALAALAPAVDPRRGRLETGEEQASLLPPEVAQIALGLKSVGDVPLAQALERVLAEPGAFERWALFPDAWPAKLTALLHDPRTGDLIHAAAPLERAVELLEPQAGPFDLALASARCTAAAEREDFEAAARLAQAARRLLARRGDEHYGGAVSPWLRLRALETAWSAAALRGPDQEALARARLAEAASFANDDDPSLLAELARVAAHDGLDPGLAETWARRALMLERRADGEESLERTAALAEVLLRLGRPGAAARRLGDALGQRARPEHGRLHLWLARALCAHGNRSDALGALRRALLIEPTLAAGLATDPWLAPLKDDGALATLLLQVEEARRSGAEE